MGQDSIVQVEVLFLPWSIDIPKAEAVTLPSLDSRYMLSVALATRSARSTQAYVRIANTCIPTYSNFLLLLEMHLSLL